MLPMTILMALGAIIFSPFVPRKHSYWLRGFARLWGTTAIRCIFNRVIVLNTENLPDRGCVIISNHQSLFDIFTALGFYPVDFLFLAKAEARKIPMVGYAMSKVGYLFIDRKSPVKAAKSLALAAEKIRKGDSVLIYPEGTRSKNAAEFLPFKPGTIKIAKQGNLPILPIVLYGTQRVKPQTSKLYLWRHPIVIKVLPVIDTNSELHPSNESGDDKAQLEKVRDMMQKEYSQLALKYGK